MTEFKLEDTPFTPVELNLDEEVTLGSRTRAPKQQIDRISLGRPACIGLDASQIDQDACAFLAGKPESSFWLLALTCSFEAVDDAPIDRAWIEVGLRTDRPPSAPEPTAWSMEPLSLADPLQVTTTVKLDASLKLTSPVVPFEIGPSAGSEQSKQFTRQLPYVEAQREGTARPSWIFSRTEITDVRGVHRLRCVIELAAGATAEAEISAGASLNLKLLGLIPYRARLDDIPENQSIMFGG
jgi:hypothetical protein